MLRRIRVRSPELRRRRVFRAPPRAHRETRRPLREMRLSVPVFRLLRRSSGQNETRRALPIRPPLPLSPLLPPPLRFASVADSRVCRAVSRGPRRMSRRTLRLPPQPSRRWTPRLSRRRPSRPSRRPPSRARSQHRSGRSRPSRRPTERAHRRGRPRRARARLPTASCAEDFREPRVASPGRRRDSCRQPCRRSERRLRPGRHPRPMTGRPPRRLPPAVWASTPHLRRHPSLRHPPSATGAPSPRHPLSLRSRHPPSCLAPTSASPCGARARCGTAVRPGISLPHRHPTAVVRRGRRGSPRSWPPPVSECWPVPPSLSSGRC